ncbi:MAG: hypothetical protein CSYNP_01536 [Syntrophus sp. SKADARSKE-3]|nr:hypothetical protein [Syntrophus sp. SKADARSKE-3]
MMDDRLRYLDRYLENTEQMLQALCAEDLETVNRCLIKNADIMLAYEKESANGRGAAENKALKEKIDSVMKANRQCFLFAENKCRVLKREIEEADKNRIGIKKYGAKQALSPRFIDKAT